MSYPKSCLKRDSVSSTATCDSDSDTRYSPLSVFLPPIDFGMTQRLPSTVTSTSELPLPSGSQSSPSSLSDQSVGSSSYGATARRKSVSFCDEDDVRLYYPPRPSLPKQAKHAATRIFREFSYFLHPHAAR